ncbi:hypothetical protein E4U50_000974 [Claviceps purpurea]|nr:hypothetical protein E4U50_000974 [Claviceps purpurea]
MKFSTVLGTFALSTLEAYHACASPLEPGAQSLEGRGTEYCCVETIIDGNDHSGILDLFPIPCLSSQESSPVRAIAKSWLLKHPSHRVKAAAQSGILKPKAVSMARNLQS